MFNSINSFVSFTPVRYFLNCVDILLVAAIFYILYLLIYNSRAFVVVRGLVFILIMGAFAKLLELKTLSWFFSSFFQVGIIAIVILFQHEIKQALVMLGSSNFFRSALSYDIDDIQKILNAVYSLAKKKVGVLIVFQRNVALNTYITKPIVLKSAVSSELIETIFYKNNPLHDGALVIDRSTILWASAYLPLTENEPVGKRRYGSWHRAALGISEHTDALSLIVSEETGTVSIALGGELYNNLSREQTLSHLNNALGIK